MTIALSRDARFEEVREVVAGVLGVAAADLGPEMGPGSLDQWDSFAQLAIVTALEEHFGVRYSMQEIQSLQALSSFVTSIEQHLAA